MESIQIIYDQDYKDKLLSEQYSNKYSAGEDYKNRNDISDFGLKSLKDQANGGTSSNETRVLSQMCNCIKNNETRLNGYIRRMFSLDGVLMS